jgi:hypothetical protein
VSESEEGSDSFKARESPKIDVRCRMREKA